jgi:GNAT superfamily N-acetyltransferase
VTILLRPYQPSDRAAMTALLLDLNRHENAISGESLVDAETAEIGAIEAEEILAEWDAAVVLAEIDGEPAGLLIWYVATGESYLAEKFRRYGKVDALVVATRHRGKGVGKALLEEAERLTRERGLSRMMLHVIEGNDGAAEAYRKFGFRPHSINMAKPLD